MAEPARRSDNQSPQDHGGSGSEPATKPRDSGGKLPVLTFLGGRGADPKDTNGSLVSALVLGALAMVVALMAMTVAIGRTPQEISALPSRTTLTPTPAAPTTYTSPEQTDTRWEAEPIITGVPQKPPSYEPPPAPPKTSSREDSDRRPRDRESSPNEEGAD